MTVHLKVSVLSSSEENKDLMLQAVSNVSTNNINIYIMQLQDHINSIVHNSVAHLISECLLSHSLYPRPFSSRTVRAALQLSDTSNPPEKGAHVSATGSISLTADKL